MEQYPKDEFDELAEARTLRGAHRKKRSPLRVLIPFLAVLIIAPALGWGVVELMSQDGMTNPFVAADESDEESEAGESDDAADGGSGDAEGAADPSGDETDNGTDPADPTDDTETADPTDDASEEPTEEPSEDIETLAPVPGVSYDASVLLYNGTGVPGGAAEAESTLRTAGYTNITVQDYAGATPANDAIYFASNELYATGQNVAQNLVINFWAENAGMTGALDIVIYIR